MTDFDEFCHTASLYRDRKQGRVLVWEWARRYGGDVEKLLALARLSKVLT
jgi:hypothetical protein